MAIYHGCGILTCQFCYGDDITEHEIAFMTEQRLRREARTRVQAPAPPKPPGPSLRPTPMPHAYRFKGMTDLN